MQSLHVVAPPVEYFPATQRLPMRLPAVAPVEHAYPGSHARQSDVPPGLYLPGPQGDPADVVEPRPHDDPAGAAQSLHADAPATLNRPTAHWPEHVLAVAPGVFPKYPAVQL